MPTPAFVAAVLGLSVNVLAASLSHHYYQVHEKRDVLPEAWSHVTDLPSHHVLPVKIHLKQTKTAEGVSHLMDISDPDSPNYGKHWSSNEVMGFFRPSDDVFDRLYSWLNETGLSRDRLEYSHSRGAVSFRATVSEAQKLLRTTFREYHHAETESTAVGCDEYSLPRHIREHVDFVTPSTLFQPRTIERHAAPQTTVDHIQRRATTANSTGDLSQCPNGVTPECIMALYDIPKFNGTPSPSNAMGILQAEVALAGGRINREPYSQADLDSFFSTYAPRIPNGTHPIDASVNGGQVSTANATDDGSEAMLDYSIAFPIVYPQRITAFVSADGFQDAAGTANTGIEAFLDALDEAYCDSNGAAGNASLACGSFKPPNVLSVSYAVPESAVDFRYASRVCDEFMKLGLQGTTVTTGSGDFGVGAGGRLCGGEKQDVFLPEWFGTCPYVLTVGGTQLPAGADVTKHADQEIVWTAGFGHGTGGGFSNYYPRPTWQDASVQAYLDAANLSFASYDQFATSANETALGAGTDGLFNRAGRAIPDVSALANNISLFKQGAASSDAGTSAAAPLWGAVITRINEERLAAGKGPVGFVNPTLYKNAAALHDVAAGGDNEACMGGSFPARKGWDPETGLGTPDYGKLLDVFMALP